MQGNHNRNRHGYNVTDLLEIFRRKEIISEHSPVCFMKWQLWAKRSASMRLIIKPQSSNSLALQPTFAQMEFEPSLDLACLPNSPHGSHPWPLFIQEVFWRRAQCNERLLEISTALEWHWVISYCNLESETMCRSVWKNCSHIFARSFWQSSHKVKEVASASNECRSISWFLHIVSVTFFMYSFTCFRWFQFTV